MQANVKKSSTLSTNAPPRTQRIPSGAVKSLKSTQSISNLGPTASIFNQTSSRRLTKLDNVGKTPARGKSAQSFTSSGSVGAIGIHKLDPKFKLQLKHSKYYKYQPAQLSDRTGQTQRVEDFLNEMQRKEDQGQPAVVKHFEMEKENAMQQTQPTLNQRQQNRLLSDGFFQAKLRQVRSQNQLYRRNRNFDFKNTDQTAAIAVPTTASKVGERKLMTANSALSRKASIKAPTATQHQKNADTIKQIQRYSQSFRNMSANRSDAIQHRQIIPNDHTPRGTFYKSQKNWAQGKNKKRMGELMLTVQGGANDLRGSMTSAGTGADKVPSKALQFNNSQVQQLKSMSKFLQRQERLAEGKQQGTLRTERAQASPNDTSPTPTGDPSPLSARLQSQRRNFNGSRGEDDTRNQLSMGWPQMGTESRNTGPENGYDGTDTTQKRTTGLDEILKSLDHGEKTNEGPQTARLEPSAPSLTGAQSPYLGNKAVGRSSNTPEKHQIKIPSPVKIEKEGNQQQSKNIQNQNSGDNLKLNLDISKEQDFQVNKQIDSVNAQPRIPKFAENTSLSKNQYTQRAMDPIAALRSQNYQGNQNEGKQDDYCTFDIKVSTKARQQQPTGPPPFAFYQLPQNDGPGSKTDTLNVSEDIDALIQDEKMTHEKQRTERRPTVVSLLMKSPDNFTRSRSLLLMDRMKDVRITDVKEMSKSSTIFNFQPLSLQTDNAANNPGRSKHDTQFSRLLGKYIQGAGVKKEIRCRTASGYSALRDYLDPFSYRTKLVINQSLTGEKLKKMAAEPSYQELFGFNGPRVDQRVAAERHHLKLRLINQNKINRTMDSSVRQGNIIEDQRHQQNEYLSKCLSITDLSLLRKINRPDKILNIISKTKGLHRELEPLPAGLVQIAEHENEQREDWNGRGRFRLAVDDFQIAGGPSIPTVEQFLARSDKGSLDLDKRWNHNRTRGTNLSSEFQPHKLRAKSANSKPINLNGVTIHTKRSAQTRRLQKFIVQMRDKSNSPPPISSRQGFVRTPLPLETENKTSLDVLTQCRPNEQESAQLLDQEIPHTPETQQNSSARRLDAHQSNRGTSSPPPQSALAARLRASEEVIMNKDIEMLMAVDAMDAAKAQGNETQEVVVEIDGIYSLGPAMAAGPRAPVQRSTKKPAATRREAPTSQVKSAKATISRKNKGVIFVERTAEPASESSAFKDAQRETADSPGNKTREQKHKELRDFIGNIKRGTTDPYTSEENEAITQYMDVINREKKPFCQRAARQAIKKERKEQRAVELRHVRLPTVNEATHAANETTNLQEQQALQAILENRSLIGVLRPKKWPNSKRPTTGDSSSGPNVKIPVPGQQVGDGTMMKERDRYAVDRDQQHARSSLPSEYRDSGDRGQPDPNQAYMDDDRQSAGTLAPKLQAPPSESTVQKPLRRSVHDFEVQFDALAGEAQQENYRDDQMNGGNQTLYARPGPPVGILDFAVEPSGKTNELGEEISHIGPNFTSAGGVGAQQASRRGARGGIQEARASGSTFNKERKLAATVNFNIKRLGELEQQALELQKKTTIRNEVRQIIDISAQIASQQEHGSPLSAMKRASQDGNESSHSKKTRQIPEGQLNIETLKLEPWTAAEGAPKPTQYEQATRLQNKAHMKAKR